MDNRQKVLIIGLVWPEPKSSAAGNRMVQLIQLFLDAQYHVTFASAASISEYSHPMQWANFESKAISLNNDNFDFFIADLKPSVVLFDRFITEEQFGWRVVAHVPNSIRLLDTEDLHCLRIARQKAFKAGHEFKLTDLPMEEVAKREIASILRCDVSLIVSEFEMTVLTKIFKVDPALIIYLPIFAEPLININSLPGFHQRENFVFIGNFLHDPNKDAVRYLKQTIWPLIQAKLPNAEVHIYGAYPSPEVLQWNDPKNKFRVLGRADDAETVISNARVVLAPLRFGAGIKGKLLEAMQYGTPSVTTSIGSEAMHGSLPWNGVIADVDQDIADGAIEVYTNEAFWAMAQQYGQNIISSRFLKSAFSSDFVETIIRVQNDLELHRRNNFIGAMLLHHSMRSTEFMSRWIEAKNRVLL
jgi:glycosyltransferase involved in cell wall biosynthesis